MYRKNLDINISIDNDLMCINVNDFTCETTLFNSGNNITEYGTDEPIETITIFKDRIEHSYKGNTSILTKLEVTTWMSKV
jgi:hypothetical protein